MNSEHPTVARHQAWFASGGILQYFVGCSESVRPLCICHAMWKTPLVLWPLLCTWRGLVRKSWSISAPFSLWKSFHAANIVALEAVLDGRWLDEWSANLIDITRTAALEIMFAFHNWSTLLTIWTHSSEKHIYLAYGDDGVSSVLSKLWKGDRLRPEVPSTHIWIGNQNQKFCLEQT